MHTIYATQGLQTYRWTLWNSSEEEVCLSWIFKDDIDKDKERQTFSGSEFQTNGAW